MTQKIKIIIGIAAFTLVIAGAVIAYNMLSKSFAQQQNDISLAEGQEVISNKDENMKAPNFTMTDNDGNEVKLSDIIARGKPVVLNFWASWCPPCKEEMPDFDKVYAELGEEIEFMMVDLTDGQRETVTHGQDYIKEQGFTFPVYFDTLQEGANTYGIRSIPTTLFIDKDGYVVTGMQGAISEKTLRNNIEKIK